MVQKLELNPVTGQLDLVGLDEVKWGEITGDINDQTDLISLIPTILPTTSNLQDVTTNGNTTDVGIVATALNKQNTFNGDGVTVFNTGSNETVGLRQDRIFMDFGVGQISVKPNLTTVSAIDLTLPPITGTIALLSDITGGDNIYNSDGTLTSNRTVGLGSNNLTFSGTSTFTIDSSLGNLDTNLALNPTGLNISSEDTTLGNSNLDVNNALANIGYTNTLGDNVYIQIDPSAGAVVTDTILNKGIQGNGYFGLNYDDNTYVQKKYVDDNLNLKVDKTILVNGNDLSTDVSLGLQSILDVDNYTTSDINIVGNGFNVVDGSNAVIASLSGVTGNGELLVKSSSSNSRVLVNDNTIIFYNNNGFRTEIKATTPTIALRALNFPNAGGTLAVTTEINKALFIQNPTLLSGNVTTETDMISAYSIPASTALIFNTYRVKLNGLYSRGAGTSTFRVYLGTTLIAYTASINATNNTNASMNGYVDITFKAVGVSGNVLVGGKMNLEGVTYGFINAQVSGTPSITATTINTTIAQQIRITHQFSAANANNSMRTFSADITLITT